MLATGMSGATASDSLRLAGAIVSRLPDPKANGPVDDRERQMIQTVLLASSRIRAQGLAMTSLYFDAHRDLQEAFGTRKLAAFLDEVHVHEALDEQDKAFIGSRDMLFLSTVDPDGNPTVSYKGGAPGFVRCLDDRSLAFPGYDGNGMFLSMGNIVGQGRVGLLFMDFETPHRLRVQGTARVLRDDPLQSDWAEAQYVVRVDVAKAWVNCPRYIHSYRKVAQSRYVPEAAKPTPFAEWKRLDILQAALPDEDRHRADENGLLDLEAYGAKIARGEA